MNHKGFAMIETMQLCPTYGKATPDKRYEERIYDVTTRDDYDPTNKRQAAQVVEDFDHIATGLLYQDNTPNKDFVSLQAHRNGIPTNPIEETHAHDITHLLAKLHV